jgi:dCTP deaminase
MFLTKKEIIRKIKKEEIKIEPFDEKAVGPISLDLTLGNEFGIIKKKKIELSEGVDYKEFVKVVKAKKIVLKPGDFILGITKEKISLPNNIAGILNGRSRFARLGLLVHATAPLVHPGVSNRQIFEIKNIGKSTLVLRPGLKIGQITFVKVLGKAKYEGIFKKQEKIK